MLTEANIAIFFIFFLFMFFVFFFLESFCGGFEFALCVLYFETIGGDVMTFFGVYRYSFAIRFQFHFSSRPEKVLRDRY